MRTGLRERRKYLLILNFNNMESNNIFNRCSVCPFQKINENGAAYCSDDIDMETGECYMSQIVEFGENGAIERFDRDYSHLIPNGYK